jgi:hypothetical protein
VGYTILLDRLGRVIEVSKGYMPYGEKSVEIVNTSASGSWVKVTGVIDMFEAVEKAKNYCSVG